jgi:hypothetical protein
MSPERGTATAASVSLVDATGAAASDATLTDGAEAVEHNLPRDCYIQYLLRSE